MKKRTGKMISLSLAVAMAMTAAPVTALAEDSTQSGVIEASELTPAQSAGETGTDTTTVDTEEEEGTAWAELTPATPVADPVVDGAATAGDAEEVEEAVTLGEAKTREVNSQASLEEAIRDAKPGDTIRLTDSFVVTNNGKSVANNEALFTLPEGVTLDGNNNSITAASDWDKSANNHIVGVAQTKGAKIYNLTIIGNVNTKHGINAFGIGGDASLDIENVIVKDCGTAGIVVNGASVTATDITTENNAWGAINVDKAGEFTLKGNCNIAEANKVWSENESGTTIDVSEVNDDWVAMKTDGADNKTYYTDLEDVNTVLEGISKNYDNVDITLTEDVVLTDTVNIDVDKNITLSGKNPVTEEIHTITGNNGKVYPAFVINNGTFTIKDVNVTEFGGAVGVANSNAVFSVPTSADADTSFNAENVNVSDFNRTAFDIRSGNFVIRECVIDCENTYSQTADTNKVLTKGILAGLGTNKVDGRIENIEIKGANSKYDEWDSAGIEIYTNADVRIKGGSITAGSTGIWVDNYYGDAGNTTTVEIQDVTVNAKDAVKVYYQDNSGTHGNGTADVTIESGNFTGAVRIVGSEDSPTNNINISGGTFSQSVSMFAVPDGYQVASADGTFSYYTTEEAANTAAKPGDIISSVANENNPDKEEVTVTMNYNDGSTNTETKTIIKDSKYYLPAPNRVGYTLTSWTDGDSNSYKAGESVTISKDTTFTAQWTKNSSGGGSSHRYDGYITVINPKNGDVSVSDNRADEGDKITLTITPDKGYVVDKIEIVDLEGDKVTAKKVEDKDNKYTFRMENCDVTVTVTFKEEGKTTDDKDDDKDEETTETTELNFTDVKESDWFFKGVSYVVDKGIMSGVSENEFAPNAKLTRAMLVQMLYNMEGRPACDAENAFIDVPVGQWYTDAVIWANDAKIVSGMGEGLFAPNMEITREQMVAMMYNYAKYKGYDVTASADLSTFTDSASVSAWAQPAMQWAVAEGYISGMGGSLLAPQGTATRAEIASVIMRFMEATSETAE